VVTIVVIDSRRPDAYVRLVGALKKPRTALERVANIVRECAKQAFADQAFGAFKWAPRYPNQKGPFLNVAGALEDFSSGKDKPKGNRFDDTPAVRDTGNLMGSIASEIVDDHTAAIGSTVPYAANHQWGLVSSQPVSNDTKGRIAKWLLGDGAEYRDKLTPMLKPGLTQWDTEIVQRPFLGVTEAMEDDIQEAVEDLIAEAANGGNS